MIAEVIVDIAAAEVDKVFDYECGGREAPAGILADKQANESIDFSRVIKKGMRVIVPFGPNHIEGFVIALKDNSALPPDKLKKIIEVIDEEPVISGEMFALMRHLTEKRHLKKVDALRLFIPAKMRGGRVKELFRQYACVSPEYIGKNPAEFIRPGANAQRDLFLFLSEEKPEGGFVGELTKSFSAAALRNLNSRGIIVINDARKMRTAQAGIEAEQTGRVTLTPAQEAAYNKIAGGDGKTFLLFGVTGSGKTEVYMRCIERAIKAGKTAIMLVPEISLTAQVLRGFRSRFGAIVSVLHSALGDGEKFDEWEKAKSGEARVVLGARSAVFAPVENVGVIIIDEEHDGSYISEHNPRYVTADIAHFRRDYNGCSLILGSATPSIESFYAAKAGEYELITMDERINKKPLPEIEIVNMCDELARGNNTMFSERLMCELDACLKQDNQAMLFLNRRGYASYVMCRKCGYVAKCERCDVSLVYHRDEDVLKCHYCGNRYGTLGVCPQCSHPILKQGNIGTQQVVEYLKKAFFGAKILRMDNDNTRTKDAHAAILDQFREKKANILVGTQMIAKGHDFPDVTLVGILDSDMSLHFADYRSVERTYQLTTQVAGRAGRDNKPGKVVLQTYSPYHYVYKYVKTGDYAGFYDKEANLREVTKYPPYSIIVRVLVSGINESRAGSVLKNIYADITALKNKCADKFIYLGYMRAPVKKIMDEYRMQILVRLECGSDEITAEIFKITEKHKAAKVNSYAEVNPVNLS